MKSKSIKQNAWDNWYGYMGRKKVRMFTNTAIETQEDEANRWLAGDEEAGHEVG
jgi:hypothetical protein